MRKKLKKFHGSRLRFKATVERFGSRNNWHGYPEPTLLLKNITVTETGEVISDHLWFVVGKTIAKLNLFPGEVIEFDARVGRYEKGYINHREWIDERVADYKLNHPTAFKRMEAGQSQTWHSNSLI